MVSKVQASCDNWDQHWSDFSKVSETAPATVYRHEIAMRLLSITGLGGGARMLDIGCGPGGFAAEFCKRYPQAQFLGLDISEAGVHRAERRVPTAEFLVFDLMAKSKERPTFFATHAICTEVLEHLDDPMTFLENATAFMAPGCRLVVTVPGGKPNEFDRHIGHRRHFNADELRGLLMRSGFEVEYATGAGFPFFNLYRLLTTARGKKLVDDVSSSDSLLVRIGSVVFSALFRLNLMRWGWQTVAVAHYRG